MPENPRLPPEQLSWFLSEGVADYAFVTFSPENRITSWSKGAERILGFHEEEALGQPGDIIFTDEDRAHGEVEKELGTALREGRAEDERWHQRKDRSRFWGSGVITAICDETGRHVGYAKVMRDLTERKLAEAALRASEERFRLLVENVREYALFQTDLKGRITSWHAGGERLFGYTSEEIVGQPASRLLTPGDRDAGVFEREIAVIAAGGRAEDARWLVRKDGSRFWARGVAEPLRDEAGQLRGLAKVLHDETERQRAEEELRTSERRFQAVAHLVPDLLWINDAEGRVTWHNQRWIEYAGWSAEQGFDWSNAIHPEDLGSYTEQFDEAMRSGAPFRHEQRVRRRDGVYRWFLAQAEPVRGEDGRILHWFGAAADIHEQRAELDVAKEELQALAAQLMTMQEDERRRIARELHDSLGQQLGVARAELAQLRPPGDQRAEPIVDSLERRLSALADDVRKLSHRLHPTILEDLGLAAALRTLGEEFGRALRIPVRVEVDEGIGPVPPGIATTIYRIAQEALANAGKHAGAGAHVSITLGGGDALHLTIHDDGQGFEPEAVRAKGGLGIVSMRERARAAGGTLRIESAPGRGTALRLTVPTPKPRRPRVVIADDHEASRYILRRFASSECDVVAEVDNGLEAVQAAERLRPELAILDVSMPGMSGVEAARLLRSRVPEMRVIFASQHTRREYVDEAFRAGAQGYIVKQAAATEVAEAIREVLSGRRFRSPLASV